MIYQGSKRYPVTEAVLHCAAIKTGQFAKMRPLQIWWTINRWHIEKGFTNGFGYHGFFMPDGSFHKGRPVEMIGAHVKENNRGTLGFLMIESREITRLGDFSDWFTEAQKRAVRQKLSDIPGLKKVSGHNDYAPKLCPGFKVQSSDWLNPGLLAA